ncbi:hypothetical protein P7K49_036680 [Saguinus oedipus]|uniref:(2E,6E)-farnesyl diphosphate synthase n=1 Tax=Saguinus oedipus TaxID=9490 RepID=A0ABQ9TLC3_SAGOE|nr:hypothetical protein P7K49_036680 [Saguinus oedipus]
MLIVFLIRWLETLHQELQSSLLAHQVLPQSDEIQETDQIVCFLVTIRIDMSHITTAYCPPSLCRGTRIQEEPFAPPQNGDQKSHVYAQEKQDFVQHFSQIVRMLTEDEMGHPETRDATAWLKEYHRGLTVLLAFRELVEPRKQDAESLQRALTVRWCVELQQAFFLVADDIMDSSLTRRRQICWYQKPGVGLDAISDAILLQACIYHPLKLYCREQPYFLNLTELFLQSSYQTDWADPGPQHSPPGQ